MIAFRRLWVDEVIDGRRWAPLVGVTNCVEWNWKFLASVHSAVCVLGSADNVPTLKSGRCIRTPTCETRKGTGYVYRCWFLSDAYTSFSIGCNVRSLLPLNPLFSGSTSSTCIIVYYPCRLFKIPIAIFWQYWDTKQNNCLSKDFPNAIYFWGLTHPMSYSPSFKRRPINSEALAFDGVERWMILAICW